MRLSQMLLNWTFTSAFLILVILALRALLGKRVSAGLRYALWMVVLVRLLVPVQLFSSPVVGVAPRHTETNVTDVLFAPTLPTDGTVDDVLNLSVLDPPPEVPSSLPDMPELSDRTKLFHGMGWVWLSGSVVTALVFLVSNLHFFRKLRRVRVPLEGIDCRLPVYVLDGLPSPCLFGLIRPVVYVTPDVVENPNMIRHVLTHEYTHYRHGDHVWNVQRSIALAVHWWNPLVWLAAVLSRRDCELACDEGALRCLGDGERVAYGRTLLTLLTEKPRPADFLSCATTMTGGQKSVFERVTRIARTPKCWLGAAVVLVLATVLACLCAFGSTAEKSVPEDEENPVETSGAGITWNDPLPADLSVTLERGTSCYHIHGTVDGIVLEHTVWFAPDWFAQYDLHGESSYPRGKLNFTLPLCGETACALDACWTDESRSAVKVTATPQSLISSYSEAGNLIFTVAPSENGGTLLELDGHIPKLSVNAPELIPTEEEAVRAACIAAKLLTAAEDYYRNSVPDSTPVSNSQWQADLNRNGVPENLQVSEIDLGQRLEVWENDEMIWFEDGYFAHMGWSAVFLCTVEGEDYLLRYLPAMGQGWCTYTYQMFTLSETGEEQVVQENKIDFDTNLGSPIYTGNFDPDAIAAFMNEINGLLTHSIQLLNTDEDLLSTFEKEGRLYDSLWWLDSQEGFTRDSSKSLLENLREFQQTMETAMLLPLSDLSGKAEKYTGYTDVQLRYQGKETQFAAEWDYRLQPGVEPQVFDWNGDGKDEIVIILVAGQGTGSLEENLYVFDAETLEQYDTSGLNDKILGSIQSTGDEENYYLDLPGEEHVTISKREIQGGESNLPLSNSLSFADYIAYRIKDGKVFCWLGCDASVMAVNYIGSINVLVKLTPEGEFVCGGAQYVAGGLHENLT